MISLPEMHEMKIHTYIYVEVVKYHHLLLLYFMSLPLFLLYKTSEWISIKFDNRDDINI